MIEELRGEVVELKAEVAELRGRLAQSSRNSSRPPSSDGYSKPPTKSLRRPSGRKPGGQEGHPGHHLECVRDPDEVSVHVPRACSGCGADLADAESVGEEVRQVFDLPKPRLRVAEHRAERRRCVCGARTTAPFPRGVEAPTQYGPRLRALALYLIAYQHLPYERAARLLGDWLDAPVSSGTLHAIVAQAADGLDEFCERVQGRLAAAAVIGVDETGARAEGRLRWVHLACDDEHTLYRLHDRRGYEGIDALGVLGDYAGIAVHDSWQPYRRYERARHALCNVHHLRELQGAIERDPETQTWAKQMDELLREIKASVDEAKARGENALSAKLLASCRRRYERVIALGRLQCPPPTRAGKRGPMRRTITTNLHLRLDQQRDQVLLFAEDFRVPFDNNGAERDLRMIKLQQKISGSWRTVAGGKRFLALRSYISTTRKQKRDLLDALARLLEGDPWLPPAAEP